MYRIQVIGPDGKTVLDLETSDRQVARLVFEGYVTCKGCLLKVDKDGESLWARRKSLVARARPATGQQKSGSGRSRSFTEPRHDGPLSPLELADFGMRVKAAEVEALRLAGRPGGQEAHKRAKRMRHAYARAEAEIRSSGNRLKSNDFYGEPIFAPECRRFRN